jgi:KipI family sensor histidine kinase inhibitor
MNILPFGDRAILAEFESLEETVSAFHTLDVSRPPGVLELVPAARTVLVSVDPARLSLRGAKQWVAEHLTAGRAGSSAPLASVVPAPDAAPRVTIPVRYDGPDLTTVAGLLGLTPAELVSRHSLTEWRCAFIGFAPGFAYLASNAPSAFEAPRRPTSREAVPAGSVGLAGEFTGIYPRSSPGGWQLIGTTDAVLWDVDRDPPALLVPGTVVRFEVVEP